MELNRLYEWTGPFRLIPATAWGSEGVEPVGPCPLNPTGDPHGPSCVSGSGSSMCGGYMGHEQPEGAAFLYTKCAMGFHELPDGRIGDEVSGRVFKDGRWSVP